MAETEILHLTPHLGGGVGKAISSLCLQAMGAPSGMRHSIVCLESPEKAVFLRRILDAGGRVCVAPGVDRLAELIAAADVIHLDWWNHPAIFPALCRSKLPPMRLVVWCHVSGLSNPFIPARLLDAAQRFVFTSGCSLQARHLQDAVRHPNNKFAVVSSGCGLEDLPEPLFRDGPGIRAGYLGSLNFGKLHPDFVDFLAAVDLPGFKVSLIGDTLNQEALAARCAALGKRNLLDFRGFRPDVAHELSRLDVLIYLLNPAHYGTAENALIEAMAMGVVPIVLDNPAELQIVEDGVTGFVVRTPEELAAVLDSLATYPETRLAIGRRAARAVRAQYTSEHMEAALAEVYAAALTMPKVCIDFSAAFGVEPADWFLASQGSGSPFLADGSVDLAEEAPASILLEASKGSVFHFLNRFPRDERLQSWARKLADAQ